MAEGYLDSTNHRNCGKITPKPVEFELDVLPHWGEWGIVPFLYPRPWP